jgi:hypothetical protein
MPVLPLVGSTSAMPGFSVPSFLLAISCLRRFDILRMLRGSCFLFLPGCCGLLCADPNERSSTYCKGVVFVNCSHVESLVSDVGSMCRFVA